MGNWTHFKILLKKNFITLKRNYCFALFFLLLPLISMGIFTIIKSLLSDGVIPPEHNFDSNPQVKFFQKFTLRITSSLLPLMPLYSKISLIRIYLG